MPAGLAALFAMALLAGCSSLPDAANPVNWWHGLEGGRIAEQRPPPPEADAPYPNLSTVPARPVVTDAAARGRIASGLLADRANAQYAGAAGADPSRPASAPLAFGRGTAPPPAPPPAAGADNPSASLQAATAPPPQAPPTPPRAAPTGKVTQQPLAAPAAGPVADATTLSMPVKPPPAPRIAGVDVPAATVPTPAPVAPPAAPAPPAPVAIAVTVLVPFQPGSAEITPEVQEALRALALRRGAAALEAIGYGDAAAGDPAAQSAALPVALARARAIAAVLMAAGVPASLVHVEAEAEGRGGAARIAR